jgi:hypothetical protein
LVFEMLVGARDVVIMASSLVSTFTTDFLGHLFALSWSCLPLYISGLVNWRRSCCPWQWNT